MVRDNLSESAIVTSILLLLLCSLENISIWFGWPLAILELVELT